jgi:hypothetical protein
MKWKMATARTTKINRAATSPRHDLEHYCRDLNGWPRSWMGLEKDLPPGEQLVALFRPFLQYLAASDLSPKTIQKHVDNMWVLGGEIIRDLNQTPSLRKLPVERLLADLVEDGGPLLYHSDSEEQQRSFESTCRKFRRFLTESGR